MKDTKATKLNTTSLDKVSGGLLTAKDLLPEYTPEEKKNIFARFRAELKKEALYIRDHAAAI